LQPLALFFSARGRLAPKPFACAVIAVYAAALLSQLLISPPAMAQAGAAVFVLVQALAIWSWFCLHAKRLRDADHAIGGAVPVAVLYALAAVLFLLMAALMADANPKDATNPPSADLADFFVLLPLVAMLTGHPDLGLFSYIAMAVLILVLIPIVMAVGFSIFAFRRPRIACAGAARPLP
jgi:uncharacterized membrane protein YhaH (DUF805 family)